MKVRRKSIHAYVGAPFVTATLLVLAASGLNVGAASAKTFSPTPAQSTALVALATHHVLLTPGTGYGPTGSQAVRAVQTALERVGYTPGPADGRYGPLTEQAVMGLQAACGLRVDGIVGPLTLAELRAQGVALGPGAGYPTGSPVVRGLQRQLAKAGSSPGTDRRALRPADQGGGDALPDRPRPPGRWHRRSPDTRRPASADRPTTAWPQARPTSLSASQSRHGKPSGQPAAGAHAPAAKPPAATAPSAKRPAAPRPAEQPTTGPRANVISPLWFVLLALLAAGLALCAARYVRHRRGHPPQAARDPRSAPINPNKPSVAANGSATER